MPQLARALLTLIGSCRIYYVFKIKARLPFNIFFYIASNMQVDSSATPLLTEDKASSLPGQFCPFHPRSTLELVEKAQGFCLVHCLEKMCFMFAPASEWKEDIECIAHHIHSDVKKFAAQLVCDCSNKLALRKSKQAWNQDRMFLTCYKKECNFFLWIDQPISHGIKERLSCSPQSQVTRIHPYGEIKKMFEKHRQEAKQKGRIYPTPAPYRQI